jgi:type II secretory pathway component PulC
MDEDFENEKAEQSTPANPKEEVKTKDELIPARDTDIEETLPSKKLQKTDNHTEKTPIDKVTEFPISKLQFRTILLSYPGAILKNTKLMEYKSDAKSSGFKLIFVGKNSMANVIGLQSGDIVLRFNYIPVLEKEAFLSQLDSLPEAEEFSIIYKRKSEIHKSVIKIVDSADTKYTSSIDSFLRYYLAYDREREILPLKNDNPELNLLIKKSSNLILLWSNIKKSGKDLLHGIKYSAEREKDKLDGIRILEVSKDSHAYKWGIQKGDKIVQINGYSLRGIQEESIITRLEDQVYFYNYAVIDLERDGKNFRYNFTFKDKYYLVMGLTYNPIERDIELQPNTSDEEPSVPDVKSDKKKDVPNKTHYFDESSNKYIPINSQTGTIYNDESLEQFNELHKALPANKLIPRVFSPEEYLLFAKDLERFVGIQSKIHTEKISKSDVEFYFGVLKKTLQDKLEILEYLNKITGEFPEDVMNRARKKIKAEVEILEKQKAEKLEVK